MTKWSGTLVDSNVLLDIFTEDPAWFSWSSQALSESAEKGPLYINSIIYAEASTRFSTIEELDDVLDPIDFHRLSIPWPAAFLAGKAFLKYKRSDGSKTSPPPDFFIGAHAAVGSFALLTRDVARYRTYFPHLSLISPN